MNEDEKVEVGFDWCWECLKDACMGDEEMTLWSWIALPILREHLRSAKVFQHEPIIDVPFKPFERLFPPPLDEGLDLFFGREKWGGIAKLIEDQLSVELGKKMKLDAVVDIDVPPNQRLRFLYVEDFD